MSESGKVVYEAPTIVDFGSIAHHTFTVGRGRTTKGCLQFCHTDVHGENSGLSGSIER